jgi:broad specificity phosphatase PhoE
VWKAVLARHGTTNWNVEKRYLGHTDIPLNETGRNEARQMGLELSEVPLDAIYSSDLRRAFETAQIVRDEILSAAGKLHEVITDSRLREMHFGMIEGMSYEEAMLLDSVSVTAWYDQMETIPPPGGTESALQVQERVVDFMNEIGQKGFQRVLIVTHGGAIRSWRSFIEKKRFWEDVSLKHGHWMECEVYREGDQ